MNWFSDQMNAAIIAGVMSLSITLIMILVAIILTNRKVNRNFNLEFAAEGVAREMLMDRKWPYRTFRVLKYHLCGFTDDELRKILVRAGGIRLTAGGQEVWGLLSRNREYLSVEEIKEVATTQIAFDSSGQQQHHEQQQQEGGPQDKLDLSPYSSGAFERVRAEMIKLGTLERVRPAARQK
jgi:hypothetical protein